jgi:hypothetical protein
MKKLLFILLFISSFAKTQTIIAYDYMETWTWAGDWFLYNNSLFFTDISVTPTTSAAHWGSGGGNSQYENDWYVLPNISLDPTKSHTFKFRLAAQRITNPGAGTSGLDVGDFVEVQVSIDGGLSYTSEIRITGFSNATWNYNTNGVIIENLDGINQIYTPVAGGNRTNTGDGWSDISLIIPQGTTDLAVDLFVRANASGEDWWIDNIELIEDLALPIELVSFTATPSKSGNIISWETASESNTDYYLIERSLTGEFTEKDIINVVPAAGNSTELLKYVRLDKEYSQGVNYYQLTQVDRDGNFKIYGPISIDNTDTNKQLVKTVNMLGQEVDENYKGIVILIYDDGTSKKVIR